MSMPGSLDPMGGPVVEDAGRLQYAASGHRPFCRLMTPSALKIYLALALLLAVSQVSAADPPTARIAEAERAVAAAERADPRGEAGQLLADARSRLAQAKALVADRDYRDARMMAEAAAATADLARAHAE